MNEEAAVSRHAQSGQPAVEREDPVRALERRLEEQTRHAKELEERTGQFQREASSGAALIAELETTLHAQEQARVKLSTVLEKQRQELERWRSEALAQRSRAEAAQSESRCAREAARKATEAQKISDRALADAQQALSKETQRATAAISAMQAAQAQLSAEKLRLYSHWEAEAKLSAQRAAQHSMRNQERQRISAETQAALAKAEEMVSGMTSTPAPIPEPKPLRTAPKPQNSVDEGKDEDNPPPEKPSLWRRLAG